MADKKHEVRLATADSEVSTVRSVRQLLEFGHAERLRVRWNGNGRRRRTRPGSCTVCLSHSPVCAHQEARR